MFVPVPSLVATWKVTAEFVLPVRTTLTWATPASSSTVKRLVLNASDTSSSTIVRIAFEIDPSAAPRLGLRRLNCNWRSSWSSELSSTRTRKFVVWTVSELVAPASGNVSVPLVVK